MCLEPLYVRVGVGIGSDVLKATPAFSLQFAKDSDLHFSVIKRAPSKDRIIEDRIVIITLDSESVRK